GPRPPAPGAGPPPPPPPARPPPRPPAPPPPRAPPPPTRNGRSRIDVPTHEGGTDTLTLRTVNGDVTASEGA
ncbi:hypothetical protein LCE31_11270, partial [Streptomyces sp. 8L]|nr:hypothetical protein [Streptomyces sp. 8L]